MNLTQPTRDSDTIISDDRISEVLALASRLKEQSGGILDDAAIEAVAEATGAPADYVRVAVKSMPEPTTQRRTLISKIREQVMTVDSRLRSSMTVMSLGIASGAGYYLGRLLPIGDQLTISIGVLAIAAAAFTACRAKDRTSAAFLGAIWGASHYFVYQILAAIMGLFSMFRSYEMHWSMLLILAIGGFVGGTFFHAIYSMVSRKYGLKDPSAERQYLVNQLIEIQDKLKMQETAAAFLSVDVVGSTRMKAENDAMAIEYTFGEYHKYIESVANRHGGRIHSTAGDGVICVFDDPTAGFDAGRAIIAGLFEFNAFRNRTKAPLQIRSGLHHGTVGAAGLDAASVNFAHVIDIAAHLQKEAEPGTLAVSESAAEGLPHGLNSVGVQKIEVDGIKAAIWTPRTRLLEVAGREN